MRRLAVLIATTLLAAGCAPPVDETVAPAEPVAEEPPSQWVTPGAGAPLTVGPSDSALEAAMTEARRTAEDARQEFEITAPEHRSGWSVKWAAPTADGRVEYVWVEPEHWSRFRVEGILVNDPLRPLECGRVMGERVGFPIEELADWVFLLTGELDGPRRGGYTMDPLLERYGTPAGSQDG